MVFINTWRGENKMTTTQVVKTILKTNKAARSNDKILWIEYMSTVHELKKKLGKKAYATLVSEINAAPAFDTIRRVRQKLMEKDRAGSRKTKTSK